MRNAGAGADPLIVASLRRRIATRRRCRIDGPVVAPTKTSRHAVVAGRTFSERRQGDTGTHAPQLAGSPGEKGRSAGRNVAMLDRLETARSVEGQVGRTKRQVGLRSDEDGIESELGVFERIEDRGLQLCSASGLVVDEFERRCGAVDRRLQAIDAIDAAVQLDAFELGRSEAQLGLTALP